MIESVVPPAHLAYVVAAARGILLLSANALPSAALPPSPPNAPQRRHRLDQGHDGEGAAGSAGISKHAAIEATFYELESLWDAKEHPLIHSLVE